MWSWLTSFWATPIPEYSESWQGKNILVFGKRGSGKSTLVGKQLPNCERISNENRSEFDRFLETKLWNSNYDKPCQVIVELADRPSYKLLATLINSRHNNLRFVFETCNSYPAINVNVDLVVFLDDSGQSLAQSLGAAPYTCEKPAVLEVRTKRYFTLC